MLRMAKMHIGAQCAWHALTQLSTNECISESISCLACRLASGNRLPKVLVDGRCCRIGVPPDENVTIHALHQHLAHLMMQTAGAGWDRVWHGWARHLPMACLHTAQQAWHGANLWAGGKGSCRGSRGHCRGGAGAAGGGMPGGLPDVVVRRDQAGPVVGRGE